jgi:hypothetical protein
MQEKALEYLKRIIKAREETFLFSPVKVEVLSDLDDGILNKYGLKNVKKGDTIEVPLWVAETLEDLGLGKSVEEGFELELFRILNREKLQGQYKLSPIKSDFYLKLRRYLIKLGKNASNEAFNKIHIYAQDLITLRLNKIISLAISASNIDQISSSMTPEELVLYREVRELVTLWKRTMLGEE